MFVEGGGRHEQAFGCGGTGCDASFTMAAGRNPLFDIAAAAQQQHVTSLRRLGDVQEEGKGVEREEAEAVKCYRIAADKGDRHAQFCMRVLRAAGGGQGGGAE
jgi:TPR repeat protein